ncbi:ParA family protein [Granulicella rosea]|nr:ParA family protein [Granulicella rosea]
MIITMASFKGGVGKSTSAVHIAAHLAKSAKTLLVDGDPNRSVTRWASQGRLPFTVVSEAQATMHARNYEHIVIDTKARPDPEDLREIATGCHLLVLPCTPDPLSVDALLATVKELRGLGSDRFRVLMTIVPPRPNRDGAKAREALIEAGLPLFAAQIPRLVGFQRCIIEGQVVYSPEYGDVGTEIEELVHQSTG